MHLKYEKITVAKCDTLIIAGDIGLIYPEHIEMFYSWLHKQEVKYKIIIPGNHDMLLERSWIVNFKKMLKKQPIFHLY